MKTLRIDGLLDQTPQAIDLFVFCGRNLMGKGYGKKFLKKII